MSLLISDGGTGNGDEGCEERLHNEGADGEAIGLAVAFALLRFPGDVGRPFACTPSGVTEVLPRKVLLVGFMVIQEK